MKSLEQLIKFVGPKHLRQTSILDDKNRETKLQKLYHSIKSGTLKDEEAIAQSLFNISSSDPVFRQLKSKLKTRLINNLFLLEPNEPQFKSYSTAFQNCRKLFFAAEILYTRGAREISVSLAEKAFRMAEKFKFSDIAELTSSFLRNGYRGLGNKQKMRFYRTQSESYFKKYLAEKQIQSIREDLMDDLQSFKGFSKEDYVILMEQEAKLESLLQENLSPFSLAYGYNALCLIKEHQQEFKKQIVVANLAIDKLSQFSFLPPIFLMSFYNNILNSALGLNDINEGKKVIEKLNQNMGIIQGLNRYYLSRNFMVLAFRTGNYQEAFKLYVQTKENSVWKKAPAVLKEEWELYAAYLFFLSEIDVFELPKDGFKGYRMGRFFNSILHLNKDKVGYNLALLILQVIYFIEKKNYDLVLDHLDSLNSYNYRYLRKDESARSQYFVKMLHTLSAGGFHRAAVLRKSNKWTNLLKKEKASISNESLRSEFIPYEVLWEIILQRLDTKIRKVRKR